MPNRLKRVPGTPFRTRVSARDDPNEKIDVPQRELDELVPVPVRIEVAGGRSSTAAAMRAARVQQELEQVGATACTVELEGGRATVAAEADRPQMRLAARLPFVRRIMRS